MQGLYQELEDRFANLDALLVQLRDSGCQYAENEKNYRIALRKAELLERSAGMPASLTGDLSRGREDVALLKERRDCSEAIYKANQEAINVEKLRIRTINDQISREWSSGGQGV